MIKRTVIAVASSILVALSASTAVFAVPTITSISPNSGSIVGGESLTINGSGFTGGFNQVVKVAAGDRHTCALTDTKRLYCWGDNFHGQLGTGDTTNVSLPVDITNNGSLKGKVVSKIYAGGFHTCAISNDDTIHCWGSNEYGQLGDGTTTTNFNPVEITDRGSLAGKTVNDLALGTHSTCAGSQDGIAHCWGRNNYGQLGNGSMTDVSTPIATANTGSLLNKSIASIAAGYGHACAVAYDDTVHCWGRNNYGQIGNGNTVDSAIPASVVTSGSLSGKTITSIHTGGDHNCVRANDNSAHCWGYNAHGQLGNNSTTNSSVPVEFTGNGSIDFTGVDSIVAGYRHTCATRSNGSLHCWGHNASGQIGNGSNANALVPVDITNNGSLSGAQGIDLVASGSNHVCTLLTDKALHCWGHGSHGQLGNGDASSSSNPLPLNVTANFPVLSNPAVAVVLGGVTLQGELVGSTAVTGISTPPHAAGMVDVAIVDVYADQATIRNGYEYVDPSADTDNDGIINSKEDSGPNDGDSNYDGIKDRTQPTVASFTNPVTATQMALTATSTASTCTVKQAVTAQSTDSLPKDAQYTYPLGVISYQLACTNDGDAATVTLYLDKQYDTTNWKLRKYNTKTKTYSDVSTNITYGTAGTVTKVTTIQYQVTDGGPLDEDGIKDGIIIDPVGPALPITATTATEEPPATANTASEANDSSKEQGEVLADTGVALTSIASMVALLVAAGGYALIRN